MIEVQRKSGLEIIGFDAYQDHSRQIYAGVWEIRPSPHIFAVDSCWKAFERRHRRLSEEGYQLIELKVFKQYQSQKVATIWEPIDHLDENSRNPGLMRKASRVVYDAPAHQFSGLHDAWKKLFSLTSFEVYKDDAMGDLPLFAGVWNAGSADTVLLTDLECEELGRRDPDRHEDERIWSHCELIETLRELNHAGYRLADLERYEEFGSTKYAALLHRGPSEDWLQVSGHLDQVQERDDWLRNGGTSSEPSHPWLVETLWHPVDFDLIDWHQHCRRYPNGHISCPHHNGLVHDGGTSGPPDG